MILGEKSLSSKAELSNKAGLEQGGIYSFDEVLDSTCERLMERQIKYSIRRIREMEERLCLMERELDEFLIKKVRKQG